MGGPNYWARVDRLAKVMFEDSEAGRLVTLRVSADQEQLRRDVIARFVEMKRGDLDPRRDAEDD